MFGERSEARAVMDERTNQEENERRRDTTSEIDFNGSGIIRFIRASLWE